MSTITPHYRTIQQLLQSQSFAIDDYQREYKWEPHHVEQLLTDLYEKFWNSYQEGDTPQAVSGYEDYFLGSIIVSRRNGKSYIVDGQQRVTTLTLLLIYLFHQADERGLKVKGTLAPLIFSDNLGVPQFNLDIPERREVIDHLFHAKPYNPDGKSESVQNIYSRYQDIEGHDLADELDSSLEHFCYWLMTKVGLIEIATDNDQYAYTIFETMNDRGKPISPVDMLKAYLLAPIEEEERRKEANRIWKQSVFDLITWGGDHDPDRDSNSIKAFLRAQYAQSSRQRRAGSANEDWEKIGTTFHRWVRDKSDDIGIGTESQNLAFIHNDFVFFSKHYQLILDASRNYMPGLEPIYYNADNSFTWQSTVLLAPLVPTDDEETARRKMAATAAYLDIWIIRRVTNYVRVSYSSTSYAMYTLCRDIRHKSLPELIDLLIDRLQQDDIDFDGYPRKSRDGINDLRLNQFTKRYIYHMLARITAYVETASGQSDRLPEYLNREAKNAYDIEHITPNNYDPYRSVFQSADDFQRWRNHIAGLLLLPADVNRSFQHKPFEQKAPHYAKENLYAASLTASAYEHKPQFRAFIERTGLPFDSFDQFGTAEQDARRELIYQLVNMIWSPERLRRYQQ